MGRLSALAVDWLATTYCPPSHRWAYQGQATFDADRAVVANGSVTCRP